MPVVYNRQSQQYVDLPQEQIDSLLPTGDIQFALNDPNGKPVLADHDKLADYFKQGYQPPNPDQLGGLLTYSQRTSIPEKIKTAAEGLAEGVAGPFATMAERAAGADPQAMLERRTMNDDLYEGSKTAGFLGSIAGGVGMAPALDRLGVGAAELVGLGGKGLGTLGKIGSFATRGAIENSAYTAADELSKAIIEDPDASADKALSHVLWSGAIGAGVGGGLGALSPLWRVAQESKLGDFLKTVKDKALASDPEQAVLDQQYGLNKVDDLAQAAGIELSPVMRSALSDAPELRNAFGVSMEGIASKDKAIQEQFGEFNKQLQEATANTLGANKESLEGIAKQSDLEHGRSAVDQLKNFIKERFEPFETRFDEVAKKYGTVELNQADKAAYGDALLGLRNDLKLNIDEANPAKAVIDRAENIINKAKTLDDVRETGNNLTRELFNKQEYHLGGKLQEIFQNQEERIIGESLAQTESPQMVKEYQQLKSEYGQARKVITELNQRLRLGKVKGPKGFIRKMEEYAKPEALLDRLTPKNDASFLEVLQREIPELVPSIKQNYLNDILWKASKSVKPNEILNTKTLNNSIKEMSPELQRFVFNDEQLTKLKAIDDLKASVPEIMNPSGTAKTATSLWSKVLAGVGGLIGGVSGHGLMGSLAGALEGVAGGSIAGRLSQEIPASLRYSLLHFIGNNKPVNSAAFKTMVDFTAATMKGESKLNSAVKDVFKPAIESASKSLPAFQISDNDIKKVNHKLDYVKNNPDSLLDVGGQLGYYMPDHQTAVVASTTRVAQYLSGLKPETKQPGVLDTPLEPTKLEEQRYKEAVQMAQYPQSILLKIKHGTVTIQNVMDLKSMYPGLHKSMVDKITNQLFDIKSQKKNVPYKVRMGLSMFMGQPLDSTMTPQAINIAQAAISPLMQAEQTPMQQKGSGQGAHSLKSLSKMASTYQTPLQAQAARRGGMR